MKTLICFATELEAASTLTKTFATLQAESLYTSAIGPILITGMGLEKTRRTLLQHIAEVDHIVNFGIVGALKAEIPIGTLFSVSQVTKEKRTIQLQEEGWKLLSVTHPLHDPEVALQLSYEHDVVDMEGFSIAEIATAHGKSCKMYKLASDYCNENTSQHIRERLPALSLQLAQAVYHEICQENVMKITKFAKKTW